MKYNQVLQRGETQGSNSLPNNFTFKDQAE